MYSWGFIFIIKGHIWRRAGLFEKHLDKVRRSLTWERTICEQFLWNPATTTDGSSPISCGGVVVGGDGGSGNASLRNAVLSAADCTLESCKTIWSHSVYHLSRGLLLTHARARTPYAERSNRIHPPTASTHLLETTELSLGNKIKTPHFVFSCKTKCIEWNPLKKVLLVSTAYFIETIHLTKTENRILLCSVCFYCTCQLFV